MSEQLFDHRNLLDAPGDEARESHTQYPINEIGIEPVGIGADQSDKPRIDRPFYERLQKINAIGQRTDRGNCRDQFFTGGELFMLGADIFDKEKGTDSGEVIKQSQIVLGEDHAVHLQFSDLEQGRNKDPCRPRRENQNCLFAGHLLHIDMMIQVIPHQGIK